MAELLGATGAAAGLLEVSINTIKYLRNAYDQHQELAELLDTHTHELQKIKTITDMVGEEETLRTPTVIAELNRLGEVGGKLKHRLSKMEAKRNGSGFQQFSKQLVSQSRDDRKLTTIMSQLSRVKMDLCLSLQIAKVGVTKTFGNDFLARADVIIKVLEIREASGTLTPGTRLRLSQLVDGKPSNDDGTITLSEEDLTCLDSNGADSSNQTSGTSTPVGSARVEWVVKNNSTKDHSIMFNHIIQDDSTKDIHRNIKGLHRTEIISNSSMNDSMMCNSPMSLEAFKHVLKQRRSGN